MFLLLYRYIYNTVQQFALKLKRSLALAYMCHALAADWVRIIAKISVMMFAFALLRVLDITMGGIIVFMIRLKIC